MTPHIADDEVVAELDSSIEGIGSRGEAVDNVSVIMDYTIIEHFSNHLYKSPNKAIEELVINGYDAWATWVKVYLNGRFGNKCVIIWDNGDSMNAEGLKGLWNVAKSPKKILPNDRIVSSSKGTQRKIIGKFGIGKVASYTLGKKIAHLCKTSEGFLLVQINYENLTTTLENVKSFQTPIRKLEEEDAKLLVRACFNEIPSDFEKFWGEITWTVAIISDLKTVSNVTPKRLRWVMGHSMPIRPDFSVSVDQEKVESKLIRSDAEFDMDFADKSVQGYLLSKWTEFLTDKDANYPITFGEEKGLDASNPTKKIPFLENQLLGKIRGRFLLFRNPIQNLQRDTDEPRTHGFFIMVRDRLLNLDDPKILFDREPNFGLFFRSQMVLYVDALDEALLADRERVQEDDSVAGELKQLLKAIYFMMLKKMEEMFTNDDINHNKSNLLPTFSSDIFIRPLSELLSKFSEDPKDIDIHKISILRKELSDKDPLAAWSPTEKSFVINQLHPFNRTIQSLAGTGSNKKIKGLLRQYEVLAVYETLFAGQLMYMGLSQDQIASIIEWRDQMYRILAGHSKDQVTQIQSELLEASFKREKDFEEAVVLVLNYMGFNAKRVGGAGSTDGTVLAGAGTATYKMSLEPKALERSGKKLENGDADVGGAARHRDGVNADFAVIIARDFAGRFEQASDSDKQPAILGECESVKAVSIMTVEALSRLLEIMDRYKYPLDELREIFETIESPSDKLLRIDALDKPLNNFDFAQLLEFIRKEQNEIGSGEAIAWKPIWQKHYRPKNLRLPQPHELTEEDFDRKVHAIAALLPLHVSINYQSKEIALRQSAANLAEIVSDYLGHWATLEAAAKLVV
jgi:Histidine kinase-, DNA gyrase B-, and HSP90-like ATPase